MFIEFVNHQAFIALQTNFQPDHKSQNLSHNAPIVYVKVSNLILPCTIFEYIINGHHYYPNQMHPVKIMGIVMSK